MDTPPEQTETDARVRRPAATDAGLLGRSAEGDWDAFGQLYDRHVRPVHAYCLTHLDVREDAEEVSQDVFVTLWRRRRNILLAGDSVLPWLIVTAKNLILNRRRALDVQSRGRSFASPDDTLPARLETPEQAAVRRELLEAINTAVDTLTATDQIVFQLCMVDGLSYDDAARALNATNGAIRNRLSRLRSHLRSELRTLKGTP